MISNSRKLGSLSLLFLRGSGFKIYVTFCSDYSYGFVYIDTYICPLSKSCGLQDPKL